MPFDVRLNKVFDLLLNPRFPLSKSGRSEGVRWKKQKICFLVLRKLQWPNDEIQEIEKNTEPYPHHKHNNANQQ